MKYEELIKTVSEIIGNDNIHKHGLTLTYKLNEENHKRMNESLFYKSNPPTATFIPNDEFEVEMANIIIKFVIDRPESTE